ncbi:FAD-dependent oxidoreductase [Leifsonia shinshuensis]
MTGVPGRRYPVIVAGAGPAGLTAALALRKKGTEVIILERREAGAARAGSRAAYLHGETLRHFETISPGLGHRVAEAGIVWHTKRTLWRGREVYCQTYPPRLDSRGLPPFTSLPQTATEDLMIEACVAAGVRFEWDTQIVTASATATGVELADGQGRTWLADYVVGADGARSILRREIGVELEGDRTDHVFVVVDLADDPADSPPRERVFHYRDPRVGGRNVLIVPFAGGWRVDLALAADDCVEDFTSSAGLQKWIPAVMPTGYADNVTWVSTYRFTQQTAESFADPSSRVLLCGEAAHLFAPFGARGMNSSVPDAIHAAEAIAIGLAAGPGSAAANAAVSTFVRERRAAARYNRSCAEKALRHLTGSGPRERILSAVAAFGAIRGRSWGKWLDSSPYGPRAAARGIRGHSY